MRGCGAVHWIMRILPMVTSLKTKCDSSSSRNCQNQEHNSLLWIWPKITSKVLLYDTCITVPSAHLAWHIITAAAGPALGQTYSVCLFIPWSQHSTSLHWERWPARVTLPAVLRLLSQPKYVMSSVTGFSPEGNQEQYCSLCCFGDVWGSPD